MNAEESAVPLASCVAVVALLSMIVVASGRVGRSSQASLTTSCSWSEDRSTDEALAVLSKDELQYNQDEQSAFCSLAVVILVQSMSPCYRKETRV